MTSRHRLLGCAIESAQPCADGQSAALRHLTEGYHTTPRGRTPAKPAAAVHADVARSDPTFTYRERS
jgi:hypothetical protein